MFHQIGLDRDLPNGDKCGAVVDVNGELTCDIEEMRQLVQQQTGAKPITYEVDHHFPGGENAKVVLHLTVIE